MSAAEHKEPNYMGVFWALLVLTLAEVGVFYLRLPRLIMVVCLVMMALAKAGLVAAYFMHLRFEKRTLAIIVISPLALSALMIIGLTPDAHFGWPRKPPTQWTLPGEKEPAEAPAAEPSAPQEQKPAQPAGPADGGPA